MQMRRCIGMTSAAKLLRGDFASSDLFHTCITTWIDSFSVY